MKKLIVVSLLAALVLAGCGGGSESVPTTTTTTTTTTTRGLDMTAYADCLMTQRFAGVHDPEWCLIISTP